MGKNENNGNRKMMAFVAFLFMIIGSVASVVAMQVTTKTDVEYLKVIVPDHEVRLRSCESELKVTKTKLDIIQSDLNEIKQDVKEILKKGDS